MKKYVYTFIIVNLLIISVSAQQVYNSSYHINKTDSIFLSQVQPLKVPELYNGKNFLTLPHHHDNSVWPYLRPAFDQGGYSCGQASSVGYNYTYEINRARNLPANLLENQYSPYFTWNFFNKGENDQGVCFLYSFEAIKSNGHPNCVDYGGMNNGPVYWMSDYEKYYNGMFNRLSDVNSIYVGDPDGVDVLKYWLYDHMEGSPYGGLANFYTDYYNYQHLPENTPEAGKCVVTEWGPGTGHSMTIVGWNDSIRYDYNEDGLYTTNIDINGDLVVDMKDWEIGGFKFINSFGDQWADSAFCYMMYKTVAEEKQEGGIWNKSVYVIDVKEDYEPLLTYKINLKHSSRDKIKVRAGVSTDTTDALPAHIHEFDVFSFQGGDHYMRGIDTIEAQKTIEFGLDVTPLLSFVTPGQPAKFFLQINEYDPDQKADGKINNFSVIDYLSGGLEIQYPETEISINNNAYTTLSIIHTTNPELVTIETNEIPAFTANQSLSLQMEADGGKPPYIWNTLSLYDESHFSGEYPLVEDEELILQGGNSSGRVVKDIDFEFPFYGEKYTTITMHLDGILGFRDESLPIPYQPYPLYLFRYAAFVSPFYNTGLQYIQAQNDKIWYSGDENFAAFRWDITLNVNNELISTDFCVFLYPNGKIEYYFNDFETMTGSEWLTGISAGDGINYQLSEFSQSLVKGIQTIRYTPQNLLPSYEMTPEGLLTVLPTNIQKIYNLAVKVSDENWISSTRHYQISSGLIFDYTINSGGDDQVEYGETAYLDLSIKNISSSTISSIVFTTDSNDPFIEFDDNAENIGTINPGQTIVFPDAISFTVSSQVPNNYYLPFEVDITSATNSWEGQFSVKAFAPLIQMGNPIVINTTNGWLNPGETGSVIVPVTNFGHAQAQNVSKTIGSGSNYVFFNSPTSSNIGDLAKGATYYDTVNITIDDDCPQGTKIEFNYEIQANPNLVFADSFTFVIGRYPVLIIDMDPELASGPIIRDIIDELGVNYQYVNYIPENLAQYQNLFVLLGRIFNNYSLTQSDGTLFADFLLNSGNIYMEGSLTWSEDPETSVHTMFGLESESNEWSLTDPLVGVNGTFTEDMEFNFDGELNAYNNYLIPAAPAFSILKKEENDHVFAVAYDEGNYKTVGSNIDLGGLVDGDHPSTKKNLLVKILVFFGQEVVITEMVDAAPKNIYKLNCYPNPLTSQSLIRFNLPFKDNVNLSVYNMQGQKISTIVTQSDLPAGTHSYKLERDLLPQGIYHCILTTKATRSSIKLVIIN